MNSIIRVEHNVEKPYVQVSRKMLTDSEIDLQLKGFLAHLLSKPTDWKIIPALYAKEVKVSLPTLYRIMKRGIETGYIYRSLEKYQERGQWKTSCHYVVFEDKDERRAFTDLARIRYG
jgi:hypothetical protein